LRAARRCLEVWRLSGTVHNGRAAGAPAATRRPGRRRGWPQHHRQATWARSQAREGQG
jgi:hypothetical protein